VELAWRFKKPTPKNSTTGHRKVLLFGKTIDETNLWYRRVRRFHIGALRIAFNYHPVYHREA
jgi:hypothetical protein